MAVIIRDTITSKNIEDINILVKNQQPPINNLMLNMNLIIVKN